jgi:hypothetical protein
MDDLFQKLYTAVALALAGVFSFMGTRVWDHHGRISKTEAVVNALHGSVTEIHDDVRDIRRYLLGPREKDRNDPA